MPGYLPFAVTGSLNGIPMSAADNRRIRDLLRASGGYTAPPSTVQTTVSGSIAGGGAGGGSSTPPPPTTINTAASLAFTGSTYGITIPILFGSDRLAGNVIWSGGARTVTTRVGAQTYAFRRINFALAVCEGAVSDFMRMWIGERLVIDNSASVDSNGVVIPNASGVTITHSVDLTNEGSPLRVLPEDARTTKITFYTGNETQLPPAAIMAIETGSPGYRGMAYILFEDFLIDEGTLPNIYVEVVANASSLLPRSYGVPSTPQVVFDDVNNSGIFHDGSNNRLYVGAFDSSGVGPIPDGEGWLVLDNATLAELGQLEFKESTGLAATTGLDTANAAVLTNGHMIVGQTSGNLGLVHTYNTTTGHIEDTLGPGGGLSGHDLVTGFGALGIGSFVFYARGSSIEPVDIFCGLGSSNRSVGFAQIDDRNQLRMLSVLNQVFASGRDTARGVAYQLPANVIADNPTWMNGTTPTDGTNILFISGASAERSAFDVSVVCYNNPQLGTTPTAPTFVSLGTLSCAELVGAGEAHTISQMFIDKRDHLLVIVFSTTGARNDRIVKFDPFTGAVLWNTAISHYAPAVTQTWSPQVICPAGKYAWISDSPHAVYKIDLETGRVETVEDDLGAQSLDGPGSAVAQQIYNGYENSITYFGSSLTKLVTKIYIDRIARTDVLVSDIVETLLTRVGLDPTQRNVEDLTTLALTGYTVKSVSSLRDVLGELATVYRFDIIESEGTIKYKTRGNSSVATIPAKYLADVDGNGWLKETQDSDFTRRRKINLIYRDIDREYANNVQSYALPRYTNEQFDADASVDVTVPIVLNATTAKTLAEILLYSKIVYESVYTLKLPQRYLALEPGDVIDLVMDDTETVTCRLGDVNVGSDNSIEATAVKEDNDIYTDIVTLAGDVGRFDASALLAFDPRYEIHYAQVPYFAVGDIDDVGLQYAYHFFILNTGSSAIYTDDVTVYVDAVPVTVSPPIGYPTWGYVVTPLLDTTASWSTDRASTLRVHLVGTAGLSLASAAGKEALTNDSHMNLALVGDELIQFQTVTSVGGDVYDLTGIVRGKFGTEPEVIGHTAGEKFILLGANDGTKETNYVLLLTELGANRDKGLMVAVQTNNPFQPYPQRIVTARNYRPWAPSDFKASYAGDDANITWQRRTRYDGEWPDDGATEVVSFLEDEERYILYLYTNPATFSPFDADTYLRKLDVTTNAYTYLSTAQTADGFDNTADDLYCLVYQIGSYTGQDTGATAECRLEYKR